MSRAIAYADLIRRTGRAVGFLLWGVTDTTVDFEKGR
jgi:hypothetical protein